MLTTWIFYRKIIYLQLKYQKMKILSNWWIDLKNLNILNQEKKKKLIKNIMLDFNV